MKKNIAKKSAAFVLGILMVYGSAEPLATAVQATDVENVVPGTEDEGTTQINDFVTEADESDSENENSDIASYAAATIAEETLTARQAQLFSYDAPVYKDHIFYGSRTGNVLMFEDYTTSGEKRYAIQSSVNGVLVRGIEEEALYGVTGDVTLVIPDTVTGIADWADLTASDYEGGFTGNATIVCEEDSAAKKYAQKNNLLVRTPAEDQKRIDALKFSDKTITVYYNDRSITTSAEENNYVVAKNGKDVTVTLLEYGATEGEIISLDKAGSASIKASDAATLEIKMEGYDTQTFDFKSMNASGTKIYLEPAGDIVIKSLMVDYTDEDGVTQSTDVYHDKFVIDRFSTAFTIFMADVDWGEHGKGTLSLYQTGSEVQFTGVALCTVLKDNFDTADDIYLVAKAKDNTVLKRKLNIQAADALMEGFELDLTGGLKITLPNKLPFLGGKTLDLDIGKFPLEFCIENGKIYGVVGFNLISYSYEDKELGNGKPGRPAKVKSLYFDVKNGFKEDKKGNSDVGDQWKNTKKLFNNKNYSRYLLRTHAENSIAGDVQLMGYFEGSLRPDGTIAWGDVQIIVAAEGNVEFSGQFSLPAPVAIPMYWKVYFKGDLEGKLSVVSIVSAITNDQTAPFQPLGSVEGGIAIGGSLGFGAKDLLSIGGGVEGSAKANLTFKRDVGNYKIGGKFSVFVEAKAFLFSWNKMWDVSQGTWVTGNFYDNTKSKSVATQQITALSSYSGEETTSAVDMSGMYTPSHYQLEDQSYLRTGGAFHANEDIVLYPVDGITSVAEGDEDTGSTAVLHSTLQSFQENTYQNAKAQMVQLENGTQIMIWLGGAVDRVSPNLTAVYYSYRTSGGAWSTPKILADDGTADFLPTLASAGNTAWVVWQNANVVFTEEELEDIETAMPKTAAAMEICAARFNGSGFDEATILTDNDIYDYSPVLAVQEEEAVVYWLQSASNDLLGTDSDACVMRTVYNGSGWSVAEQVYQATVPIQSLSAGWGENGVRYALALDMDGNMETTDDMELVVDGVLFTDNDVIDSAPTFSAGVLYWYQNGNIVSETGKTMLPEGVTMNTDQFRIYTDTATGDTAIVYTNANGTYGEIYGIFQNDGVINQPTALTATGMRAGAGVGYYADHTLYLPCAVTEVVGTEAGTEEGVENIASPYGQTDLYLLTHKQAAALSIANVSFDSSRLVAGNAFTVYVTVQNDGTLPAENFDVVLWDTPEKMPANDTERNPKVADYRAIESLAGGETVDIPLTFVLPEDFAGTYELTLTEGSTGTYNDDAIYAGAVAKEDVTFSDWDLIMTAEMVRNSDGQYIAKGVIGNVGKVARKDLLVSLYRVQEDAEDDVRIDTQNVSVDANSQAIVAFVIEDPISGLYRIQVEEQEGENNIANNADICALWQESLPGDLNGDGIVDTADVALISDWFAGKYAEIPFDTTIADVNGDGVFTRADGMYLARAVARWNDYTLGKSIRAS